MRRNTRLVQRQGTLHTGKRPFALDVVACPGCAGRLRMIATVEDPVAVYETLAARRLPVEDPAVVRTMLANGGRGRSPEAPGSATPARAEIG